MQMKILKTALSLILAMPFPLLADQRVTTALEQRACIEHAQEAANRFGFLAKKYLSNENSNTHIGKNFKVTEEQNNAVLADIKATLQRHAATTIQKHEDILPARNKVHDDFKNLSKSAVKSTETSEKFIASTAEVERLFTELVANFDSVQAMKCAAETTQAIEQMRNKAKEVLVALARSRMTVERRLVGLAQFQRFAEKATVVKLLAGFAEATANDFKALSNEIDAAFTSFALTDEVEIWRAESMFIAGTARGFWSKYYLYHKSIEQLDIDLKQGYQLENKIAEAQLASDARDELAAKVQKHLAYIKKTKQEYLAAGWENRRALQLKLIAKVGLNPSWSSESCRLKQRRLAVLLDRKLIQSSFRNHEDEFLRFMKECIYQN